MIAYVFWHRPRAELSDSEYQSALCEYHDALAVKNPKGFVRSLAFQLQQIPWLGGLGGYEDWYVLEGIAALETLEKDAVTGSLEEPHRRIASMAADGTAGLYRGRGSEPARLEAPTALWFSKPQAMSYATMFSRLAADNPEIDGRIWQRVLTLGPAPEFCLLQAGPDFLPYEWKSIMVVRRLVYVSGKDNPDG